MLVCSLMITAGSLSAQVISELPPFERAIAVIKHFEGLHNKAEHYPYVGYGHKVLPGENLSTDMKEEEADRLLRSDLMKLCKMFSGYGLDSLLLATLAYNVGPYRILGYGDRPKSRLDIIYDGGADLYNLRFYRKTFSKKTFEVKVKDIAKYEGIYFDRLQSLFTEVTGLRTHF